LYICIYIYWCKSKFKHRYIERVKDRKKDR
jgi:hypothetical protein